LENIVRDFYFECNLKVDSNMTLIYK
jgi:hypothetical protein